MCLQRLFTFLFWVLVLCPPDRQAQSGLLRLPKTISKVFSFAFFRPNTEDITALDMYTPPACFSSSFTWFRIGNSYSHSLGPLSSSVTPVSALPDFDFPYFYIGDFNIHNPAADPLRVTSYVEERASTLYFAQAADLGFSLLIMRATYIQFPFTNRHRPSAIDLAFGNPLMFLAFRSWDASAL